MLERRHKGPTKPCLSVMHCRASMKEREKLMMALCMVGLWVGMEATAPASPVTGLGDMCCSGVGPEGKEGDCRLSGSWKR